MAFAPDGTTYAAIAMVVNSFCVYIRSHSDGSGVMSGWMPPHFARTLPRVAYSRDSQRLVVAGSDEVVRVWSISRGRLSHVLEGHERAVA